MPSVVPVVGRVLLCWHHVMSLPTCTPCVDSTSISTMSQAGIGRIQSNLQTMAKKGRIPEAAAKAAASRLRGTLTYDSFDSVDLVIEAAIEVRFP